MKATQRERLQVMGLAFGCPMGICDACCPLKETRELPLKERVEAIQALDGDDVHAILKAHNACFSRRYFEERGEAPALVNAGL